MTDCAACGAAATPGAHFCAGCGAPLAAIDHAAHGRRKTVTILFCDVTGSTALGESIDPEALQALLARYFDRMSGIVEMYGGTVEKFIGDAVMAVFGIPQAHEDDALRACRAALAMIDALPGLRVQARIGLCTGEVMTGTPERLATGDAVNVAARLEQIAPPGSVLIADSTRDHVGNAVETRAVEPLHLKGKAAPVSAYELIAVRDAPARRHESTFVGRDRELRLLREAWDRAITEQRCVLVSVTGDPGVGKSRLVEEFLRDPTRRTPAIPPRTARGRCLAYGQGITYWPVVEVIKQLGHIPTDAAAAAAIRTLLRETDKLTTPDEIAWAFRKLLEESAPVVCVLDDLQWAENGLLDLVDEVALLSAGAPVLLLCLARPELSERRNQWPVDIALEPLPTEEAAGLLPDLLSPELRERVLHAAGGNPLFLTEMAAMAAESTDLSVPPDLQALLAARLDQLDEPVRAVLETGAVEGEVFHRGAVQALATERHVTPRLATLVRKQLIQPDRAMIASDDAFRFRHLLVRDAAYAALPKSTRGALHARFADWLDNHAADLVEHDEIVGYHLEQACAYRRELGELDAETERLAERAAELLARAARDALLRSDPNASTSLLRRAIALRPSARFDVSLRLDLVDALWGSGRLAEAAAEAADTAATAAAAGDGVGAARARLRLAHARMESDPDYSFERFRQSLEQEEPIINASGDLSALATLWQLKSQFAASLAQPTTVRDALTKATEYARAAGDWRAEMLAVREVWVKTRHAPVGEALCVVEQTLAERPGWLEGYDARAELLALSGRFEEARREYDEATVRWEQRAQPLPLATRAQLGWEVAMAAGDYEWAEAIARDGCERLQALGERAYLSTQACQLALALCRLGRDDESEQWAKLGESLGDPDDDVTQMFLLLVRAELATRRLNYAAAREFAEAAAATARRMDVGLWLGCTELTLARTLAAAGDAAAAAEHVDRAVEFFDSIDATAYLAAVDRERSILAG